MDKKTLNNEIVLCRAAVRKAKVAVIRKILKKMKILKTCKVEGVKEKKLRKSERLFEKVQMMKKIKVDEVTKFALRNSDLETFIQGPKTELKQNALACLAKHDAVMKKVNSIRERIPNWETELPQLLDSLGKKNKKKFNIKKDSNKIIKNGDKQNEKPIKKGEVGKVKDKVMKGKVSLKEKTTKPGRSQARSEMTTAEDSAQDDESDTSITEDFSNSKEKVEQIKKVADPFFIGKEVVAPKLTMQNSSERKNKENPKRLREGKLRREATIFPCERQKSQDFSKCKPELPKKLTEEEMLHPSWAAKRIKLIKPFQGKKITFSED